MLKVTELYARSFDLDRCDIFWKIADFHGDIHRYEMSIWRSESSFGPYEPISPVFEDKYHFIDVSPPNRHKWRVSYYKLKIRDKQTDLIEEFGPTAQLGEPDLIALEVNRQEDMLFREYIGRLTFIFPVRTFGAYCICYDRTSNRRTRSGCLNCYDTGYLGGYLTPIATYVQFDPSGNSATPTSYRERQENKTTARLIAFPQVKPKDVLIEAENVRWKVESVTSTQRLRSSLHQELTLKQIDPGEIEFKLPININDLRSLQISSERNFSNPMHVDEPDDPNSLLAVYGFMPRGTVR